MESSKDIRFSDKKVDETWKETVARETGQAKSDTGATEENQGRSKAQTTPFIVLISSLGMQALIQLGEVEDPATGVRGQDLTGAQATIDLLADLNKKTRGNLSKQEVRMLEGLLYDLQMKFVEYNRAVAEKITRNKQR
ncbi:MAG: DUF1844 domain-containing protein [Candidatus Omnitrophica bacterium]|nr:DUF1844 domain-containing protein [Candidatus Omnitrophota bacterium]